MKGLSYSFLRAVCALVIGLVLVMFPNQAGDYFVITIGVIKMQKCAADSLSRG